MDPEIASIMDFTNVIECEESELETLTRECEKLQQIYEELQENLAVEQQSAVSYKIKYEENMAKEQAIADEAEAKFKIVQKSIYKEADDIRILNEKLENEIQLLKEKSEAEILSLMKVIAENEKNVPIPKVEESFNDEYLALMEENNTLKAEYERCSKAIEEKTSLNYELSLKVSELESHISEIKGLLSTEQEKLRELKENIEDKNCQKQNLQVALNKFNCQSQLTEQKKESLFDEVNNTRVTVLMEYKMLKNKYLKADKRLANMNAEIEKLKADLLSQKGALKGLETDRIKLESEFCFEKVEMERKEELNKAIKLLETKLNEKRNPIMINSQNLSEFDSYIATAMKNAKMDQEKVKELIEQDFDVTHKLYDCEGELACVTKELKHISQLNKELEKQIKTYEGRQEKPSSHEGGAKSVRFAVDGDN